MTAELQKRTNADVLISVFTAILVPFLVTACQLHRQGQHDDSKPSLVKGKCFLVSDGPVTDGSDSIHLTLFIHNDQDVTIRVPSADELYTPVHSSVGTDHLVWTNGHFEANHGSYWSRSSSLLTGVPLGVGKTAEYRIVTTNNFPEGRRGFTLVSIKVGVPELGEDYTAHCAVQLDRSTPQGDSVSKLQEVYSKSTCTCEVVYAGLLPCACHCSPVEQRGYEDSATELSTITNRIDVSRRAFDEATLGVTNVCESQSAALSLTHADKDVLSIFGTLYDYTHVIRSRRDFDYYHEAMMSAEVAYSASPTKDGLSKLEGLNTAYNSALAAFRPYKALHLVGTVIEIAEDGLLVDCFRGRMNTYEGLVLVSGYAHKEGAAVGDIINFYGMQPAWPSSRRAFRNAIGVTIIVETFVCGASPQVLIGVGTRP